MPFLIPSAYISYSCGEFLDDLIDALAVGWKTDNMAGIDDDLTDLTEWNLLCSLNQPYSNKNSLLFLY